MIKISSSKFPSSDFMPLLITFDLLLKASFKNISCSISFTTVLLNSSNRFAFKVFIFEYNKLILS